LDYSYAIYIDSDTVSLNKLDIENILPKTYLTAVKDPTNISSKKRAGVSKYFNSGVIVINLENWRNNIDFINLINHKTKSFTYPDQDLLNSFFDNKWEEIDNTNNFPSSSFIKNRNIQSNIKILHFMGGLKPWDYFFPSSSYYWFELLRTPIWWKFLYKMPITVFNSILYKLKKVF
jgi:lipopolysaccharide biosynthesis glycosyltransferase